jgi:Flagellar regulator YcgR, PilZN domain
MEEGRALREIRESRKIQEILEYLIANEKQVKVLFEGLSTSYASRIIKWEVKKSQIILDKLLPEDGNRLIKAQEDLTLEFVMNADLCRCLVRYVKISTRYPHFGFIVSAPTSIKVGERRRESRHSYETPDFVSVEFRVEGGNKVYSLAVKDRSVRGLGILIMKKDFELVMVLKPGDKIKGITFYAKSAVIKGDGIVRHVTKIKTGAHKGSYILGIESPEIIESCKAVSL